MKTVKYMIPFFALLYTTGCKQGEPKETKPAPKPKTDTVAAFILQLSSLDKSISLPGELLPGKKVQVFGKLASYVKSMMVDIGSQVKAGQTIAVLEAPEMQSRIAESKQRLAAAKAKWSSSNDIFKRFTEASKTDGVIAPADLERAKNQLANDAAQIDAAKADLAAIEETAAYLVVKAPFTGMITKRNADVGTYVGKPGELPLFEMEDNSFLRLHIALPETFTGTQLKDESVQFSIKALPGKKFNGKLARKSGSLDVDTRSEIWEFIVNNNEHSLKAGMFADCKLNVMRNAKSFFVPYSSVTTTLEKKFVIRVQNGTTGWVDVGQGMNLPDKIEIFSAGLKEGDTLVLKSNEELKADTKLGVNIGKQ